MDTKIRRVSSAAAEKADLQSRPVTVVPEGQIDEFGAAHETARAIELARLRLSLSHDSADSATSTLSRIVSTAATTPDHVEAGGTLKTTDQFAFAFDIDGVLVRGGQVIPQAIEAMKVLNGHNDDNVKVPYIFVTNGGGKSEEERCLQLSRQLQLEVSPGQFICGHTPMRDLANKYKTVLVVGGEGEKCRQVAENYGFRDVVTPGDIIKDNQHTTPFRTLTETESASSRSRNFGDIEIEAIFIFADSRDWAGDQQIILDLCMSQNGRLGTRSTSPSFSTGPPIYFSHNDLVWSTSHPHTRLGMGALRASLETMFTLLTNGHSLTPRITSFGKPHLSTFRYATKLLDSYRRDTHGIESSDGLRTVYFVGDTPESDIRGTNDFDASREEAEQGGGGGGGGGRESTEWHSILVRTGVFQDGRGKEGEKRDQEEEEGMKPKYVPKVVVDDVLEAVRYGMKRERETGSGDGNGMIAVEG